MEQALRISSSSTSIGKGQKVNSNYSVTDVLTVDLSNSRVGIGTDAPDEAFN